MRKYKYNGEGFSIELLNCDCREYMRKLDDKKFELCVADPPYAWDGKYGRKGGTWAKKYGSDIEDWESPK